MTHDERNAAQIEAFWEFLREERAQTVLASSAPQRTTEFWLEWMQRPQPQSVYGSAEVGRQRHLTVPRLQVEFTEETP